MIIEATSIPELIQKMKQELNIVSDDEENIIRNERAIKTKIPQEQRTNKPFTEFEINFLIDNYRSKSTKWLAQALKRTNTSIQQKIHNHLYGELRLPKKRSRSSKAIMTGIGEDRLIISR